MLSTTDTSYFWGACHGDCRITFTTVKRVRSKNLCADCVSKEHTDATS